MMIVGAETVADPDVMTVEDIDLSQEIIEELSIKNRELFFMGFSAEKLRTNVT